MIEVVGAGIGGYADLAGPSKDLVDGASVVVSSPRLLGTVPPTSGARRLPWPSPMLPQLESFLADVGPDAVVLATGDPLVSGIGSTLVRLLGPDRVRVHPAVGSVALARARMGWAAETVTMLSLVSQPAYVVRPALVPGARLVLLSKDESTPAGVASVLAAAGWQTATVSVLGRLGAPDETRRDLVANDVAGQPFPALNVVCVSLPSSGPAAGRTPGLPDDAFGHDGQLTKREVRAVALAALRPMPGQRLWDLGAGAGSVAIEWARSAPSAAASAVERDPARAEQIRRNAESLGVRIDVHEGTSESVVGDLPSPDAVFVGGGAGMGLVDTAWAALRPHGRLVVHAVTLETEGVVVDGFRRFGGDLRRLSVERAEPLGRYLSWTPSRPVVHWVVVKPPALGSEKD